jgi:hypothetical protein
MVFSSFLLFFSFPLLSVRFLAAGQTLLQTLLPWLLQLPEPGDIPVTQQVGGTSPILTVANSLSGGQILVTVAAGLVMAIAFQFLLTNLGLALGISFLSFRPRPPAAKRSAEESDLLETAAPDSESTASFPMAQAVGIATGVSILLTVSGVLAIACFLAVRLTRVPDPVVGGILGLLIWATYMLLLTWLSSVAVGSVMDTALSSVTRGFRQLLSSVRSWFRPEAEAEIVSPEAVSALIRQEVESALDPVDFTQRLQTYLDTVALPQPSPEHRRTQLRQLLQETLPPELSTPTWRKRMDRRALIQLVGDRTSLSPTEAADLVDLLDELEAGADEAIPQDPVQQALYRVLPSMPSVDSAARKSASTTQTNRATQRAPVTPPPSPGSSSPLAHLKSELGSQARSLLQQIDTQQLMRQALEQVDLSEWDLERLWNTVQSFTDPSRKETQDSDQTTTFNLIQLDGEDYLRRAYVWELHPDALRAEFPAVLRDTNADPRHIWPQLTALNPAAWKQVLTDRGDLESDQIEAIVHHLTEIRATVQQEVQADLEAIEVSAEEQGAEPMAPAWLAIQHSLETYLRYTNLDKLTPEGITQKLDHLMAEHDPPLRSPAADRPGWEAVLSRRQGLTASRRDALLDHLEQTWLKHAGDLESAQTGAGGAPPLQVTEKITEILPDLSELRDLVPDIDWQGITLEDLKPDLIQILSRPHQGLQHLGRHLGDLDWTPLIQHLQAQHLNERQIQPIVQYLQRRLYQAAHLPQRWIRRTHPQNLASQLRRYLRYQAKERLTPDAIRQDLEELMTALPWEFETQATAEDSPFPVSLEDLQTWLRERPDLAEAEVEELAAQLQETGETIYAQIQRLRQQTQSTLEDWLQTLQKQWERIDLPNLDWESIQQEVSELLSSPLTYLGSLQDTVQRTLQQTLQHSLGSLLRQAPSLSWEAVSLDHLRDRLTQATQDALVQVSNLRDDLSETVTQQLITQIETARDQILDQIERLQTELQAQVDHVRRRLQHQAEAARKMAAIAAWWIFLTTLSAGICSAIAGVYAVMGLPHLTWPS